MGTTTSSGASPSDDEFHHPKAPLPHLALAALGIIYGDIGTSPLSNRATLTGAGRNTASFPATPPGWMAKYCNRAELPMGDSFLLYF